MRQRGQPDHTGILLAAVLAAYAFVATWVGWRSGMLRAIILWLRIIFNL